MRYAAPVWSNELRKREPGRLLECVQRKMALRVARAFRTVWYETATLLAGLTSICLLVEEDARVYQRLSAANEGEHPQAGATGHHREMAAAVECGSQHQPTHALGAPCAAQHQRLTVKEAWRCLVPFVPGPLGTRLRPRLPVSQWLHIVP